MFRALQQTNISIYKIYKKDAIDFFSQTEMARIASG
jgi:hypothetical protein